MEVLIPNPQTKWRLKWENHWTSSKDGGCSIAMFDSWKVEPLWGSRKLDPWKQTQGGRVWWFPHSPRFALILGIGIGNCYRFTMYRLGWINYIPKDWAENHIYQPFFANSRMTSSDPSAVRRLVAMTAVHPETIRSWPQTRSGLCRGAADDYLVLYLAGPSMCVVYVKP